MIFAINTSNSYVINSTGLGILYRVNFLALRDFSASFKAVRIVSKKIRQQVCPGLSSWLREFQR